jgi:hypothetical protein
MLNIFQYVGSDANTVPFEQVPAVVEARQLIQNRILQSLGKSAEFNEVLRYVLPLFSPSTLHLMVVLVVHTWRSRKWL